MGATHRKSSPPRWVLASGPSTAQMAFGAVDHHITHVSRQPRSAPLQGVTKPPIGRQPSHVGAMGPIARDGTHSRSRRKAAARRQSAARPAHWPPLADPLSHRRSACSTSECWPAGTPPTQRGSRPADAPNSAAERETRNPGASSISSVALADFDRGPQQRRGFSDGLALPLTRSTWAWPATDRVDRRRARDRTVAATAHDQLAVGLSRRPIPATGYKVL